MFKLQIGSAGTRQVISSLSQLFARFGIPKQLVTANGPQFVAKEFSEFCRQQGILHNLTPPYHPQSNGQAERFIQSFQKAVKKGLEESGVNLHDVVHTFLDVYRNTAHNTTGESPAKLLFGRELRCPLDLLIPDFPVAQDKQSLKQKVRESQAKQKKFHDTTSRD